MTRTSAPRHAAALLALVVAGAAAVGAQEPSADKLCPDCHTTGRIPHAPPKKFDLAHEQGVIFCSDLMEADPVALGLDWIPCPSCLAPSLQAEAREEFERKVGARRAWLEQRRATVDEPTRTTPTHLETDHFVLSFDLPRIKVDKRPYDRHQAAHLYARRLEELRRQIVELHAIPAASLLPTKHEAYMFESQRAANTLAPLVTNQALRGTQNTFLVGPLKSTMVSWDDPQKIRDDVDRHQYLVHVIAHHLYNNVQTGPYGDWLYHRNGWLFEGISYFWEMRLFGDPRVACGQEMPAFKASEGRGWEPRVKKAVLAGEQPSIPELMGKSASVIVDAERPFAWSYVDFLIWHDPAAFVAFVSILKSPSLPPARDALRQAYGMTMGEFQERWEEFVRREYALRVPDGPRPRTPRTAEKGTRAERR